MSKKIWINIGKYVIFIFSFLSFKLKKNSEKRSYKRIKGLLLNFFKLKTGIELQRLDI